MAVRSTGTVAIFTGSTHAKGEIVGNSAARSVRTVGTEPPITRVAAPRRPADAHGTRDRSGERKEPPPCGKRLLVGLRTIESPAHTVEGTSRDLEEHIAAGPERMADTLPGVHPSPFTGAHSRIDSRSCRPFMWMSAYCMAPIILDKSVNGARVVEVFTE